MHVQVTRCFVSPFLPAATSPTCVPASSAGGFILRIEHGKPKDVPEVETRLTGQIVLIDEPRSNVSDASLQYLTK
jgi:hypothetical protein